MDVVRRLSMYTRARRTLGVCILAFIVVPAFIYSYKYVFDAELYEGDELEERVCRYCEGSGKDEEMALELPGGSDRCPACRGRGRVEVIIPGAHRPVRLRGLVLNASRVRGEPSHALRLPWKPKHPFEKHPAALSDATVTLTPPTGDPITFKTSEHGRFSTRLAPGTYRVEVRANRFTTIKDELTLKRLTAPIWREKAHILEPLGREAARSRYGVELRAILGRQPEVGEIVLLAASPW